MVRFSAAYIAPPFPAPYTSDHHTPNSAPYHHSPRPIPSFPYSCPHPVIPAKAGIHTPALQPAETYRGSGFRPTPE